MAGRSSKGRSTQSPSRSPARGGAKGGGHGGFVLGFLVALAGVGAGGYLYLKTGQHPAGLERRIRAGLSGGSAASRVGRAAAAPDADDFAPSVPGRDAFVPKAPAIPREREGLGAVGKPHAAVQVAPAPWSAPALSSPPAPRSNPAPWSVPAHEVRQPPFGISEDVFEAGARLYGARCASCHGSAGQDAGSGPQLWKKHGNAVGVSDQVPGQTFWRIARGHPAQGMPAYEHVLSDTQIWQVTLLLKNADRPLPDPVRALLRGAGTSMER